MDYLSDEELFAELDSVKNKLLSHLDQFIKIQIQKRVWRKRGSGKKEEVLRLKESK